MIIPCFRCRKEINTPDETNADYIIAPDMIVQERRPTLVSVPKTQEELDTEEASLKENLQAFKSIIDSYEKTDINPQSIPIEDIYGEVEAIEEELARGLVPNKSKPMRGKLENIQKSGIICPDCYKPDTDFVIWGVHKK